MEPRAGFNRPSAQKKQLQESPPMKALLLDKPGPVSDLRVGELPLPEPGPDEIRVKVHAVSLNPVDYKLAGRGNNNWAWPHVLGLDVAGVVDAVGAGVAQWQTGDRVFYHGDLTKAGGFAEYAITTAHTTARIPNNVSYAEAAAIPCAGLTAYEAVVRRLDVQPEHTVWMQGGAGGVGGFGVQICTNIGATVITTASAQNHEFVKSLGADHAIDYNTENVVEQIMEITNGCGVDRVLGAVDVNTANEGIEVLKFRGGIACVAGMPTTTDTTFSGAKSIHNIAYGGAHTSTNRVAQMDLARMAEEMIALVAAKKIDPMIEQTITLDQISKGLTLLQTRHVKGKIVVEIA
jgi:NADPH:quinone reductase-like Zn-dependent oxidoreductase|tara:strand:- start:10902 stop:11945 length:1044 start_codon:yes stop_codon:yes gene_type:complete